MNIIINSLPPPKIIVVALKTQLDNLNIDKIHLQLKALEEDIKLDKNHELILTRDKPSDNSFLYRPKLFKNKFNSNRFKMNLRFQKHQANVVKYKYGKLGHIQKNCMTEP